MTVTSEEPLEEPAAPEPPRPKLPAEPVAPITNRFLFVDVAAMRAKQLKRGALVRLGATGESGEESAARDEALPPPPVAPGGLLQAPEDDDLLVRQAAGSQAPTQPERKLERVAMQEVKEGLVEYQLPDEDTKGSDG